MNVDDLFCCATNVYLVHTQLIALDDMHNIVYKNPFCDLGMELKTKTNTISTLSIHQFIGVIIY